MSVYNGRRYVAGAVQSVLNQSFGDFEFILIDDGSTDGSAAVMKRLADADDRIRLVHQSNQGLTASLNRGLRMARGTYIARMDDDDLTHPERFERQVRFLNAHPEVGIVGTRLQFIDAGGRVLGEWSVPSDPADIAWRLLFNTCLCHPSIMVRRRLFDTLGGYAEWATTAQDYELFSRAVLETQLANLPDILHWKRRCESNITAQRRDEQVRVCCRASASLHRILLGPQADTTLSHFVTWMEVHGTERAIAETGCEDMVAVHDYVQALYEAYREQLLNERTCIAARHNAFLKLRHLAGRIATRQDVRAGGARQLGAWFIPPVNEMPLWSWWMTRRIGRRSFRRLRRAAQYVPRLWGGSATDPDQCTVRMEKELKLGCATQK
jgi:glycosyltransferase involved in cell wall biosynthesis